MDDECVCIRSLNSQLVQITLRSLVKTNDKVQKVVSVRSGCVWICNALP